MDAKDYSTAVIFIQKINSVSEAVKAFIHCGVVDTEKRL